MDWPNACNACQADMNWKPAMATSTVGRSMLNISKENTMSISSETAPRRSAINEAFRLINLFRQARIVLMTKNRT
jgi:hypothetical protein